MPKRISSLFLKGIPTLEQVTKYGASDGVGFMSPEEEYNDMDRIGIDIESIGFGYVSYMISGSMCLHGFGSAIDMHEFFVWPGGSDFDQFYEEEIIDDYEVRRRAYNFEKDILNKKKIHPSVKVFLCITFWEKNGGLLRGKAKRLSDFCMSDHNGDNFNDVVKRFNHKK